LQVDLDSQRLLEHHQVAINQVHLKSADILLTREEDGRWNWQKYRFVPPAKPSTQLPIIVLEDLRIQLTLKHGPGIPAARLLLTAPELQAVPSSSHGYDFDGAIDLPGAGLLEMGGMCDLKTASWNLEGRMRNVRADHQLLHLAHSTNPELQGHITQLDSAIENALPHIPPPQTSNSRPNRTIP
jgi:hypothetical protein